MEEPDWWTSPYKTSRANAFKYMAPEILLLRGLWKENKSLWWFSFPFHLGLYLVLATFVLLLISAGLTVWGPSIFAESGVLKTALGGLVIVCGWIGLAAGLFGSLGLLLRRLVDREMRLYAAPADYFNLVLFLAFFACGLLTAALADPAFDAASSFVAGFLTAGRFASGYQPGQTLYGAMTILLGSLLAAYIPLTHMSHMFMKYFLYHQVKWDDAPSRPGNAVEAAVLQNLNYRPSWSAKHVDADGHKSWKDIASSKPGEVK